MHEDDKVADFNAWNWLGMGGDKKHTAGLTVLQQEENALYVLGVAGLASKKLLQKHHLVSSDQLRAEAEKERDTDGTVLVECVATDDDHEKTSTKRTKMVQLARGAVQSLSTARRTLHECQSRQLRTAAHAVVRAPVALGRRLFQLGGGQTTVGLTATLAVALVFVLVKPAAYFVASESVNMTRGA